MEEIVAFFFISVSAFIFILAIRWIFFRQYMKKEFSKLPGLKTCHPIFGHLNMLVGGAKRKGVDFHVALLQSLLGLSNLFRKEGMFRVWYAYDPNLYLYSADAIEPVLNGDVAVDKSEVYTLIQCWLKTGLLTSEGKKWKTRRKLLTPTFHYRILDDFIPVFDHNSKLLVKELETRMNEKWIDIIPVMTRYALRIICETAMGINMEHYEEDGLEYGTAINEFANILIVRSIKPWLYGDAIFYRTAEGKKLKKCLKILHNFTRKVMKERKEKMISKREVAQDNNLNEDVPGRKNRKAFLDLLLHQQMVDHSLSDEDICEEVDTFMFAGHDTTSSGISWTLYHLGLLPEVQDKLYNELLAIFGDDKEKPITSHELKQMKYLECVIKESQRLSPTIPMVLRYCGNDIKIKGYTVPRGTNLALLFYALHRDPTVFPNPEIFDPDRFLPENCFSRHPYAFIPFSAGSRNCIGQKFAMMEMKSVISQVIRNFVVKSVDPRDKVHDAVLIVLKPKEGLKLRMVKRQ